MGFCRRVHGRKCVLVRVSCVVTEGFIKAGYARTWSFGIVYSITVEIVFRRGQVGRIKLREASVRIAVVIGVCRADVLLVYGSIAVDIRVTGIAHAVTIKVRLVFIGNCGAVVPGFVDHAFEYIGLDSRIPVRITVAIGINRFIAKGLIVTWYIFTGILGVRNARSEEHTSE